MSVPQHIMRLAEEIVNSDRPLGSYTACSWNELDDNGKEWIANVIQEAQSRMRDTPPDPSARGIHEQQYRLTIHPGGDIRVSRNGLGQTIRNENLQRFGWNALADAARVIEGGNVGGANSKPRLPMKPDEVGR